MNGLNVILRALSADDMLRTLAKNGGVVMINYNAAFLSEAFRAAPHSAELRAKTDDVTKRCGQDEACSILEGQRVNREAMQSGELPMVTWDALIVAIPPLFRRAKTVKSSSNARPSTNVVSRPET